VKRAILVLGLTVAAGCSSGTEVVVTVDSSLMVPRDLQTICITVTNPPATGSAIYQSQDLPVCSPTQTSDCFHFPISVTLTPGSKQASDTVRVEVLALPAMVSCKSPDAAASAVTSDASVFTFVKGESQRLDFFLYPSCLSKQCAMLNQACGDSGSCVGIQPQPQFSDGGSPPDAASPVAPPPSCVGLLANCGPMTRDDCCDSPMVPGGMFYRGYDVATDGLYSDKSSPATVIDFRLDKYEVTVGRFRKFLDAGMGTQANPPMQGSGAPPSVPSVPNAGWDASFIPSLAPDKNALIAAIDTCDPAVWTDVVSGNENLPMNCVTWVEALAFCAWDGGFLPTTAQWNYAAAGGDQQRAYPWSNPPSSTLIDSSYAVYATSRVGVVGALSPKGDGRWGQSDLAGNIEEWTLDDGGPYPTPCYDCVRVMVGYPDRDAVGGHYATNASYVRAAGVNAQAFTLRYNITGFRCGRAN
jgi:formylglycine-generating enzyme required for sulfatase activity